MTAAGTRYTIDASDLLASADPRWDAFARAGRAPWLERERVLGRSLWEFISDGETRHLYEIMLARVRANLAPIALPFRCDAPDRRRLMRLVIAPLARGSLQFDTMLEREEPRPRLALLDTEVPRSQDLLVVCSWCKRLQVPVGEWQEAEDAIARLGLFSAPRLPLLSHGICPACERSYFATAHGDGTG